MPRKKTGQAQSDLERAHEVRLAYLSRNHEFCGDLRTLAEMSDAVWRKRDQMTAEQATAALGPVIDRAVQLGQAWDLPFDVVLQLSSPEWRPGGAPHRKYAGTTFRFGSPVVAWTTLPPLLGSHLPKPTPEENRYLNVRVDLSHPVETLLPLIEKELRRFAKSMRGGRRRLNEADFYLAVFDLAESGQPYRAIAAKLGRPITTIKSAYLSGRRSIYGASVRISKKALPLVSFDAEAHAQSCPTCRVVDRFEEMCPRARRYGLQDWVGQTELTGFDTVRDTPDPTASLPGRARRSPRAD